MSDEPADDIHNSHYGNLGGRPALSIREAASAAGVGLRTIRRHLDAKPSAFPNAYRMTDQPQQPWRIPVADLLAAGFRLQAPSPPDPEPEPEPAPVEPERARLAEVDQLRADLAAARERAAVAEAVAAERERHLEDLRAALAMAQRQLEAAAPIARPAAPEPSTATTTPVEPVRRRWWHRSTP